MPLTNITGALDQGHPLNSIESSTQVLLGYARRLVNHANQIRVPHTRLLPEHLPTVQHVQFTTGSVNVAIATTHIVIRVGVGCAFGGTILLHLIAASTLLRDAERHGNLEYMAATVGRSHFASTGINATVRATRRAGNSPARLPAGPRGLAVLSTGAHLKGEEKMGIDWQVAELQFSGHIPLPAHRSTASFGT